MTEEELPPGWARTTLGEVGEIVSGATPKTKTAEFWGGSIPWLTPDDLSKEPSKFTSKGRRFLTAEGYDSCSAKLVPAGSILYSSRAPIGYVTIARNEICTNQGFKTVVPDKRIIDPDFLYWYLIKKTPEIKENASGTTFQEISAKRFSLTEISVPPLKEQKRIVDALESYLSRLEFACNSLTRAKNRSNVLKISVLGQIFNENNHSLKSVEAVAEVRLGRQRSPKNHFGNSMRPYLRAANVGWNGLILDDVKEMNFSEKEIEAYRLQDGDILMNEASGSPGEVGKPAIWNNEISDCCFQNTLIRLRPIDVLPQYLYYFMRYEALRGAFRGGSHGVGIHHLTSSRIANWRLPVPNLATQKQTVDKIEKGLEEFQSISDLLNHDSAITRRAKTLRKTLLRHAFDGRLTAQDTESEPASDLIQRIRTDGEAQSKPKRKRQSSQAKASTRPAPPISSDPTGSFVQEELQYEY